MKNISFLNIIIFSLIFFSCKNDKKRPYKENIKSEIIDSVKINFKVLDNDKRIKKINSFFQRKFSRNQFNGNILFAEKDFRYNISIHKEAIESINSLYFRSDSLFNNRMNDSFQHENLQKDMIVLKNKYTSAKQQLKTTQARLQVSL